jgi:hypothetical protein
MRNIRNAYRILVGQASEDIFLKRRGETHMDLRETEN